jgi:hypothetical protein
VSFWVTVFHTFSGFIVLWSFIKIFGSVFLGFCWRW